MIFTAASWMTDLLAKQYTFFTYRTNGSMATGVQVVQRTAFPTFKARTAQETQKKISANQTKLTERRSA